MVVTFCCVCLSVFIVFGRFFLTYFTDCFCARALLAPASLRGYRPILSELATKIYVEHVLLACAAISRA